MTDADMTGIDDDLATLREAVDEFDPYDPTGFKSRAVAALNRVENEIYRRGGRPMTEAWRNHYDAWKHGFTEYATLDDDGEEIDQDELDAQAEAAAEERAERAREDAMFDRDDREDW